MHNGQDEPVV